MSFFDDLQTMKLETENEKKLFKALDMMWQLCQTQQRDLEYLNNTIQNYEAAIKLHETRESEEKVN